ncbi:MAG: HlyD family type I secretion periplasmic adaptor subunit, partial [Arcobacteraceae bacterium]|nr:HlyD family type I secretion periplasmic adaptor subunit [Arcobacteraceae bacterium]
ENKIRLSELMAKGARLKAESQGLDMEDIVCDEYCDGKLMKLEKDYYISNQKELHQRISKQQEQLKYQMSALIDANNRFSILTKNHKLLSEEFKVKKKLEQQKIFTKYELNTLERSLNDSLSSLQSSKEIIVQTKAQIQEIKNTIEETKLTFKNKAAASYSETISEILRLKETNKNLLDIIDRTVVRSPVDGIVKELFIHTIGSSIPPASDIMTIVPDNYKMIAKIKMKPTEIAKLHIGQDVKLTVTAFDYSIYGDLKGKIINISPDTIIDPETGESEYLIYVKTKRNYLNNNEKYKIKVGMMVNANVLVGKKSIMSYLLKPILKTTQRD